MLVYKIPREPTAPRVAVWRQLKQLGAILLQDAVWVIPANARTQEQFQWLAAEIAECGGSATLWSAAPAFDGHDADLVEQFEKQADQVYGAILRDLKKRRPDLLALARRFQQAQAQDYFHSKLGKQVREALLAARGGNEK